MSKVVENRVLTYMRANNVGADKAEHASSIVFEAPRPYVAVITDLVAQRYLNALLDLRCDGFVFEDPSGRFYIEEVAK